MTHKALSLIPKDEISRDFLIARATAISRYAILENSLASFFSSLMGTSEDIAGITFFRINNARSRIAILERLLKKKYEDKFNSYWNSLAKHLRNLDGTRNNIVHWATETYINTDLPTAQQVTSLKLIPPNFWDRTQNSPDITLNELYDFILKCDFFARLINIFNWDVNGNPYAPQKHIPNSNDEMYSQPISYPPPDDHPLLLK